MDNSAQVLTGLLRDDRIQVKGVVTTPPAIIKHQSYPNPVQLLAEAHGLPVSTPSVLDDAVLHDLSAQFGSVEILLTAGYGKLLPPAWLRWPTSAALNLHFSDLPRYRGANPAEWAIIRGETQTGITLIEMSPEFDTGTMVAQCLAPISSSDTRESVYQQLYQLGGLVVGEMLVSYQNQDPTSTIEVNGQAVQIWQPPLAQPMSPTPYAKRLTREDGYITWENIQATMAGQIGNMTGFSPTMSKLLKDANLEVDANLIERMCRALYGFPTLWTTAPTNKGEKRLKIWEATVNQDRLILQTVQVEGLHTAAWNQVKNGILF